MAERIVSDMAATTEMTTGIAKEKKMVLQWLAALSCLVGAVYQFGAYKAPEVEDEQIISAARKITGVAMFVAFTMIAYRIWTWGEADPVLCLVCGLFGLGQTLFGFGTLQPNFKQKDYGYSGHGDLRTADGRIPPRR